MSALDRVITLVESFGETGITTSQIDGRVTYSGRAKLQVVIQERRQNAKPKTGESFWLRKPKALDAAKRAEAERVKTTPADVLRGYVPEWLDLPVLTDSKKHTSPAFAWKESTERVVDRTESVRCGNCKGKGNVNHTSKEPDATSICGVCGGSGGDWVDGSPRTCSTCGGSGSYGNAYRTTTQTYTCKTCGGSGSVEKKIYKKQKYYRTWHVVTRMQVKGKDKHSALIQSLNKVTNGRVGGIENLSKYGRFAEMDTREKNGVVDITAELVMPFEAHEVQVDGNVLGCLYTSPSEGFEVCIAEAPFLDRLVTNRLAEYRNIRHDEVEAHAAEDPLLAQLLRHSQRSDNVELSQYLCFAISKQVAKKAQNALQKAQKRGKGVLGRLGLR